LYSFRLEQKIITGIVIAFSLASWTA